ncbi:MAG: EAL domain-containing protein [Acidobacteriota bacterium]|nr:EAL domain-containing protein [Acidobacteriota bacterium]
MSREKDRKLQKTVKLQRAAIESAANAIFITDETGMLEWANPAFEELTGYRVEEVIGRSPRILKSGEQDDKFYDDLWGRVLEGKVWQGRVTNRRKTGELYTAEQTITPIRDDDGSITNFVAIHEDITSRLESEQLISHMALHDCLTDLPNRYAFDRRIDIELTRGKRLDSRVAVLCIDIDNFKEINDTFGHSAGDELLVEVGRRLAATLRTADMICRLGGDEFAVVQPDIASRENAGQLAERLLQTFADTVYIESQEIFVSASLGVAVGDQHTASGSELLKQADLALYRAKDAGRNTYRFFEDDMDREIKRRMRLAQNLRRAVERDELFLEYQPQVSLGDRRVAGVEALVRWRNPELGMVGPAEFVPIAESSGLIDEIGLWVLRTACEQARAWQDRGLPALPVSINISAIQLHDPGFVDKVKRVLAETHLEPRYLELELTERVLLEGKKCVEETLQTLSKLGVSISLDDFGKGYASLDYLRRYPLNKVKIDQSFVHDMGTNARNATIVAAVIELAEKLDLQVIAEGVEPVDLLQRLIDEGCEQVQGFYFSRPVLPDDFEALLTLGSDRIQAHAGLRRQ